MVQIIKYPRISVEVTQDLIDDATKGDSGHCMIAEAVKKALPWAAHVSVDLQTIRYSDPRTRARYVFLTPRMGQSALVRFDAGEEVVPFRMQLRNPHITAMSPPRRQRDAAMNAIERNEHQEQVREMRRGLLAEGRRRKLAALKAAREDQAQEKAEEIRHGSQPRMKRAPRAAGPGGAGGEVPRLEGGKPPPTGALFSGDGKVPAGRRRQYGIRALDKGSSVILRSGEKEEFPRPKEDEAG